MKYVKRKQIATNAATSRASSDHSSHDSHCRRSASLPDGDTAETKCELASAGDYSAWSGGFCGTSNGAGVSGVPLSVWLEIAEREQLLVVAPDGSKKGWNDSFAHVRNKPETDDTGMIRGLIAHMIRAHEADPQRVYVIGVSKGGMMAYRLATELGSMLAAFASVLANMPQQSVCAAPVTPISALIVASTRDPLVPYGGGKYFYTPLLSPMKSIDETIDIWRTLANLPATGKSVDIPKSAASNPTSCTRVTWGDNPEQLQVVLLRINGGGHAEPSRSQFYPWFLSRLVGAQNTDIDIAEEAWAFFKDKRCKDAGGNSLPETTSGESK